MQLTSVSWHGFEPRQNTSSLKPRALCPDSSWTDAYPPATLISTKPSGTEDSLSITAAHGWSVPPLEAPVAPRTSATSAGWAPVGTPIPGVVRFPGEAIEVIVYRASVAVLLTATVKGVASGARLRGHRPRCS